MQAGAPDAVVTATMQVPPELQALVSGGSSGDAGTTSSQLQVAGQIAAWNAEMLGVVLATLIERPVGVAGETAATLRAQRAKLSRNRAQYRG